MTPLTLPEAIEFTCVGVELVRTFKVLDALPSSQQIKGEPVYDRWRELALRYNAIREK